MTKPIATMDERELVNAIDGYAQSAKRTRLANPIGNHPHAECGVPLRNVGDDPDVVRHARDRRDLPIDDAAAAYDERCLVGAPEASRAAAR